MQGRLTWHLLLNQFSRNEYSFVPCFSDEIVVVLHPEHPWAKNRKVSWEQAENEQFILPNWRGYTFRKIEKFLKESHLSLNTYIELNSVETMKELVVRKLGLALMSDWTVKNEIKNGKLIALLLAPSALSVLGVFHLFKEGK